MKTKLQKTLSSICCLLISLTAATAQSGIDPATSLPVAPVPTISQTAPPSLDPNTGLPPPAAPAPWVDRDWSEPVIVLTNVMYDGLPLSEVAKELRQQFKAYFDILPMPATSGTNWGDTTIELQLRNVRASEVFNAMNLVFENNQTPLRWDFKPVPHGRPGRPLVLLRVLPEAAPHAAPGAKPPETHRMVYFVGHLVGDEKSGGMTMEQIVKTISDLWPGEFGKPEEVIQFHKDAQLLVVNGKPDQLEFIHQTLAALEEKVAAARPKSGEAKDTEDLINLLKSLKKLGDDSK